MPKGQSQMDNLVKHRVHKTQDEDKANKKQNTICAGHHYTQRNTNNVNTNEPSYKHPEVKTNRILVLCRNCNGHHDTGLITHIHIIEQQN